MPRILVLAAVAHMALFCDFGQAEAVAKWNHEATLTAALDSVGAEVGGRRFMEADTTCQRLHAWLGTERGVDSLDMARLLDQWVLVRISARWAATTETRNLAARVVSIRELAFPRNDTLLVRSLANQAFCARFGGELDSAVTIYWRAIKILESSFGPDDYRLAIPLNSLAATYRLQGDYVRGRDVMLRALRIRELHFGPESMEAGRFLMNVGVFDLDEADLLSARDHFERSWRIKRMHVGPRSVQAGLTLVDLGEVARMMGDRSLARQRFEESISILADSLPAISPEIVTTRLELSGVLLEMGAIQEARRQIARASADIESARLDDPAVRAQLLDNEAFLAQRAGEIAKAESLAREDIAAQEQAHGQRHPDAANARHRLGTMLVERGQPDSARAEFQRELDIVQSSLGAAHPDYARALVGLAQAEDRLNLKDQAIAHALEGERISRDHARIVLRGAPERVALNVTATRVRGLDLALRALCSMPNPADSLIENVFDSVVRSRALVLDEIVARRRAITTTSDSAVDRAAARLFAGRQALANLYVRGYYGDKPESFRKRLAEASTRCEALEESLAVLSQDYRGRHAQPDPGSAAARKGLPKGSALLSYVVQEGDREESPQLVAFVISAPGASCRVVPLGSASRVDSLVRDWLDRAALAAGHNGDAMCRRAGTVLRQSVWDPVASLLKGTSRVVIVPDGQLNFVDFGALPVDAKYLVEIAPLLQVISAERDLAGISPVKNQEALIAIGGPDYDRPPRTAEDLGTSAAALASTAQYRGARPTCRDLGRLHFVPLPDAKLEAAEVEATWRRVRPRKPSVLLTGPRASKSALRRLAASCSVLHLATHAYVNEQMCSDESPLLRSGIALAGANLKMTGPDEDEGILTAAEIATLDLPALRCVVLSSCESARGEVSNSEGVFGLRRAFAAAGASVSVMTAWKVSDPDARQWMRSFYQSLLVRGRGVAESVRQASLERLTALRRQGLGGTPMGWGGFIAVGVEQ